MPRKGGQFERDLCRTLTTWWTGDPNRDVIFWRTSQSGGRATTRNKKGKKAASAHCGDVAALDAEGELLLRLVTVEVKRGYNGRSCTIADLLDKPKKAASQMFDLWLQQAKRSSEQAGTPFWLIVHKRDKREAVVYFPIKMYDLLVIECAAVIGRPVCRSQVVLASGERVSFVAVTLEAFLAEVTPKDIRTILREVADMGDLK